MDIGAIAWEIVHGSVKTVLMFVAILAPLMIFLEVIKDANLLNRAARWLRPVMRVFTLPEEGAFPILAGVFFGISYGSGVILPFSQAGVLSRRDMTLIGFFFAACHGIIEDTAVFSAIGAIWWVLLAVRVVLGVLIMWGLSRLLKQEPAKPAPAME